MDQKSAFLYEELMNIAKSRTGETKSLAILALGSIGKKDENLCELLLENATNPEYYIRGNAINSLGRLKLSPERALPIIIAALEDKEGYDWTVQECAIKALGNYDNFPADYVISLTSILKVIRKKLKDEQEQGWITQIIEVNQALKKLRNNCN
jgi:HEAT repeat protein